MFYMETFNNLFWRDIHQLLDSAFIWSECITNTEALTLSRRDLNLNSSDHQQKPNPIIVLLFNENNS